MAKKATPSNEQLETTNKVITLRQNAANDVDLAASLGMSKVTLYTRLKKDNWKITEIVLINLLYENLCNSIKNEDHGKD